MIAWFGLQYKWPSAFLLYWLSFNVFQMGQQLYLVRRFGPQLAAAAAAAGKGTPAAPAAAKNVTPKPVAPAAENRASAAPAANGTPAAKKKKKARP